MTEQERQQLGKQQMDAYIRKHRHDGKRIKVQCGYTKEEAEKLIKQIKKGKQNLFHFESGDGVHFTTYTKEEMIDRIKSQIKDNVYE